MRERLFSTAFENLKPISLGMLPDAPVISVLMPNYNYGRYIGEAIESVLGQTYPHWELIICDDGSTDNSQSVVEKYRERDSRVKLLQKENGGMASALNTAYKESRGSIICLLDSDDAFLSDKLEFVVKAFKLSPQLGFVIHKMQIVDSAGIPRGVIPILTPPETGYIGAKVYRRGGRWRYMPSSAICLRREVADILFPINEDKFRSVADAYIFTLAPIVTTVAFVDEVLSVYRLHGSNLTGMGDLSPVAIRKNIRNIEQVVRGVNDKLATMGLPPLNIYRNLSYLEQKAFLSLAEGQASLLEQLRQLSELTVATLKDDLYAPVQKLGALGYWFAIFLPRPLRISYLKTLVYPSKLKYLVKTLLNMLKPR